MRITCEEGQGSIWHLRLKSEDVEDVALDAQALADLETILDAAEAAQACRVLVLQGGEGRFCLGMSFDALVPVETSEEDSWATAHGDTSSDDAASGVLRYAACVKRLRLGRPAVIALVDGPALGGGLGLAAAADTLIATSRARFGLPEARVGLLPAMVLPLLAERMPPQKVRRLALSGVALDVTEALELGLVDRAVDDLAAAERALFGELKKLLRLAPRAVAELRRFSATSATMGLDAAIDAGAAITSRGVADPSVRAAIAATLDGALPPWHERPRRLR